MLTFCIRDDDTCFFTSPQMLRRAYGDLWEHCPVSFAIIPFVNGGKDSFIPEKCWSDSRSFPLGDNPVLVDFLKSLVRQGHAEVMLHGFRHQNSAGRPEFAVRRDLRSEAREGREYLEELLKTSVCVFTPPHNSVSRAGLRAVVEAGLDLGIYAGLRSQWPVLSASDIMTRMRVRAYVRRTGYAYPWPVSLSGHREVSCHSVTPLSDVGQLERQLRHAHSNDGVFCLATHHWELDTHHVNLDGKTARGQIATLLALMRTLDDVRMTTVGEALRSCAGRRPAASRPDETCKR